MTLTRLDVAGAGAATGAGVLHCIWGDFDKWLPFFNVTFCGHATAAGLPVSGVNGGEKGNK